MRPLVRTALRGSLKDVRQVKAVAPGAAQGLVARVYAQAQRDFGVVAPPLAVHSPAAAPLAAAWMLLRETLLAEGRVGRAVKEAVAIGVSQANDCPYCVEVHEAKLAVLPGAADAAGPLGRITDWARTATARPGSPEPAVGRAPFGQDGAAEIIGVAVTFHYLNRMVRLFLPDSPVPDFAPAAVRGPVLRMVARSMRPARGARVLPGDSLGLLPSAPLPDSLAWAKSNPAVAGALARAVASVDAAADRWVADAVRERLHVRLALQDGGPGPSRFWIDEALAGLPADALPAARLALLVALAPYQVTDADIDDFRAAHPSDRELVELTSWAALTAAVHLGSRLAESVRPEPETAR